MNNAVRNLFDAIVGLLILRLKLRIIMKEKHIQNISHHIYR